jgi:uncharacterized protein
LTSTHSDSHAVSGRGKRGGNGSQVATHSGGELREMFAAATTWLERNAQAINSINVFPVPDGDTGTNMYLTMRATMDEAYQSGSEAANVVAGAMARGALMGARGNSGVILSQILRGLADGLSDKERFDSGDFVVALDEAAVRADRAVTHPVEGTILTVMRAVAAAAHRSKELGGNLKSVLVAAVDAAKDTVAKTPTLLPTLREAGVVDAGGQGLYVMLEGALRYLRGDLASLAPLAVHDPERTWARTTTAVHDGGEGSYGFCTEFLLSGEKLNAGSMLERMLELGDSVLVVGDESLLRVHLHTATPDAAIAYGRSLGELAQVKVDNIEEQAEQFVARVSAGYEPDLGAVGIVGVVSGAGLEEVFRSLGAAAIVQGGATMNPSIRQILNAIGSCSQEEVIVLPNNKNVILGAQQAAKNSRKQVRVVRTTSVPQGMAALLALNPEQGLEANAALMEEARDDVRTIEITKAIRTTSIDGLRVRVGQAIALIDGKLTVAEDSPRDAVRESLKQAVTSEMSLVTIYYGAESTAEDAEALAAEIHAVYPSLETEVVYGGQPHYTYIVSLE